MLAAGPARPQTRPGRSLARSCSRGSLLSLLVLLLTAAGACGARPLGGSGASSGRQELLPQPAAVWRSGRQLRGLAACPDGCSSGGCVSAGTGGGLRCIKCRNTLVVNKVDGTCGCPAGKYADAADSCADCPKGSFCTGGTYNTSSPPASTPCPAGMTTLGLRSTSNRACVNNPGYVYFVDGPSAALCPVNTWSAGLRKQRACTPCPSGYGTDGLTGRSDASACIVPAGFTMKAGTVTACTQGEWKAVTGTDASCTPCAAGLTTAAEGATSARNCSVLLPGFYAASIASGLVAETRVCPQSFYCPGGVPGAAFNRSNPAALSPSEPTIKACPDGMWTVAPGATAASQCLTPPGFYTMVGSGSTLKCPAGSFRADWAAAGAATACTSCGVGVFAASDAAVTAYSLATGAASMVAVTTSVESCYIKAGQGLYYMPSTGGFRARNCSGNMWGVNATRFGLSPAVCKECPVGMVTSANASAFPSSAANFVNHGGGAGGFTSKWACVNPPGWGLVMTGLRPSSEPCPLGAFNPGDTYTACTSCATGLTTAAVGAGRTTRDCGIAAGFGFHNGSIQPCPLGYFNDLPFNANLSAACTACPLGTTTVATGSESAGACDLCEAGFGGANCSTQCGGTGAAAAYGPAGRPRDSVCIACDVTSFSFNLDASNASVVDVYESGAAARLGATADGDCVSQWGQYAADAWELPLTDLTHATTVPNITTFAACLALCQADSTCQFVTFDYTALTCLLRTAAAPELRGAPLIAFRLLPAGNASAVSGHYSFYQEPNALAVGWQAPAPGAASFTTMQQCLDACDADASCAGMTMQLLINVAARATTCQLIRGNTAPGTYRRSAVRADTSRLSVPALI